MNKTFRSIAFAASALVAPFVSPAFGQQDTVKLTKTEQEAKKKGADIVTNNNYRDNIYYQYALPYMSGTQIFFERTLGKNSDGAPSHTETLDLIYTGNFGKTADENDIPTGASFRSNSQWIIFQNIDGKWSGDALDDQISEGYGNGPSAEKLNKMKQDMFKLQYGDQSPQEVLKDLMLRFGIKAKKLYPEFWH